MRRYEFSENCKSPTGM